MAEGEQAAAQTAPQGGGAAPEFGPWTSQIQKEVLDTAFAGYKTLTDFAKHHKQVLTERDAHKLELEKLRANAGFKVPGDNAKPEEIAAFRKAFGVPEAPEGYEIAVPSDLHDKVTFTDAQVAEFKKFAHEAGLSVKQAKALVEWDTRRRVAAQEALLKQRKEDGAAAMQELQRKYGSQSEARLQAGLKLLASVAPPGLAEELDRDGIGNHPKLVLALVDLAARLGEDSFTGTGGLPGGDPDALDFDAMYPSMKHLPGRRA